MQRRINVSVTEQQYKKVKAAADLLEIRPGTYARYSILSAAGCQVVPDIIVDMSKMRRIKQLSLFDKK